VLAFGVAILGAGVAMLALPGPGLLVVVVGLAVLATEFAWAERALDRTTTKAASAASKVSSSRRGRLALITSGIAMFMGGALVAALVGDFRVVGISVGAAGLIGLAMLHPGVQRWIDARTTTSFDPAETAPAMPVRVAAPVTDPLSAVSATSPAIQNGAPS
jgi:uncharacterized protein (TIGR02611 family)